MSSLDSIVVACKHKILVSTFDCFGLQLKVMYAFIKIIAFQIFERTHLKEIIEKIHSFSKKKITIDQLAFGLVVELFLQ